ncbi:unnamed protein product [marine sediment metagenome]|uniref:Uncharacterized protein n=1 Tax=marine sediment metagenome TaxID=412755 RepID=X1FPN9_9ZZZZ
MDFKVPPNFFKGDYDQALQYCKQSLSIKEISKRSRLNVLETLSEVYNVKSEFNRVYFKYCVSN